MLKKIYSPNPLRNFTLEILKKIYSQNHINFKSVKFHYVFLPFLLTRISLVPQLVTPSISNWSTTKNVFSRSLSAYWRKRAQVFQQKEFLVCWKKKLFFCFQFRRKSLLNWKKKGNFSRMTTAQGDKHQVERVSGLALFTSKLVRNQSWTKNKMQLEENLFHSFPPKNTRKNRKFFVI